MLFVVPLQGCSLELNRQLAQSNARSACSAETTEYPVPLLTTEAINWITASSFVATDTKSIKRVKCEVNQSINPLARGYKLSD